MWPSSSLARLRLACSLITVATVRAKHVRTDSVDAGVAEDLAKLAPHVGRRKQRPPRLRNTSASSEWSAIIASRRRSASAVKDGSAITWYCSHALMTAWIALTSVAVSAVGVCFGYVMGNRWDRISPPKRKSRSTMG